MRAMWASFEVRCRFLEHFFLGLSCFGLGGAGLAPPGRSALALVPELHVSSLRHTTWLNFADFCSSGDFFAYRNLLSTIVCDIAVLLVLVLAVSCLEVLENNLCNPFYRWFSWGRTIVYPDAFVLHRFEKFPAGQCLMMYDERYLYMETHVSCMCL